MSDTKQLLESMIESKEALEKSIELLQTQNSSIVSNYSSWNPTDDTIWAFKTNYINQIKPEKLITAFCANDYMIINRIKTEKLISAFCDNDYLFDYSHVAMVLPIGLFDDGGVKLERVISPVLESLKKLHKNTNWEWYWNECMNNHAHRLNQSLDHVEKITSRGKVTLEGSVIFYVRDADFTTITEIEKYLTSLNYYTKHKKLGIAHFKASGERVTIFEYDCEKG